MSRTSGIINPTAVYTTTEVARAGMTEKELEQFYTPDEVRTYVQDVYENDRHFLDDEKIGFMKIHFTRVTGKIL